jgi:integrase/recombinase XerD
MQPHAEPRPTKRAGIITSQQLARMLELATPRDAALVSLMAAGACRVGETLLLRWSDISSSGLVTVPGNITKTRAAREFVMPEPALEHLERWRMQCPVSSAGWLFPGVPIKYPLSIRAAQRAIQRLAGAAGVENVSSHSMRRSALTAAHAAGLPMRALAELSGHASLGSLERYLDAGACKDLADAARMLMFEPCPSIVTKEPPAVARCSGRIAQPASRDE